VMIYLTELAGKLEIDPVEAAKAKMRINEEKYLQRWSEARPPTLPLMPPAKPRLVLVECPVSTIAAPTQA
jgi:hypothetical protein